MNERRTAAVIVSSDRAHDGAYEDRSGPAATSWLSAHGLDVIGKVVVPDEAAALR